MPIPTPEPPVKELDAIQARLAKRREPRLMVCQGCGLKQPYPQFATIASQMASEMWRCSRCGGQMYTTFLTFASSAEPSADDDLDTLLGLLTAQAQQIEKLKAEIEQWREAFNGDFPEALAQWEGNERLILDLSNQLAAQAQAIAQLQAELVEQRVKGHGEGQEHTIADVNAGRVDDLIMPRLMAYGQMCWEAGYKQAEEAADAARVSRAPQEEVWIPRATGADDGSGNAAEANSVNGSAAGTVPNAGLADPGLPARLLALGEKVREVSDEMLTIAIVGQCNVAWPERWANDLQAALADAARVSRAPHLTFSDQTVPSNHPAEPSGAQPESPEASTVTETRNSAGADYWLDARTGKVTRAGVEDPERFGLALRLDTYAENAASLADDRPLHCNYVDLARDCRAAAKFLIAESADGGLLARLRALYDEWLKQANEIDDYSNPDSPMGHRAYQLHLCAKALADLCRL